MGYCMGGIALHLYLSSTLCDDRLIASVTYMATPFDFIKMINLRVFLSPESVNQKKQEIMEKGVFDGEKLMTLFSILRTNEMYIKKLVDIFYYGKKEAKNDFLFWNEDYTHLPAQLHLEFLTDIFFKNAFLKKRQQIGALTMKTDALNLPIYIFAAEKDHIVPWQSSFSATKIFRDFYFCLGGGGHVTDVINPVCKNKFHYAAGNVGQQKAKHWHLNRDRMEGSWWVNWLKWVAPYLGDKTNVKRSEPSVYIEKAPGRYALQKAPKI